MVVKQHTVTLGAYKHRYRYIHLSQARVVPLIAVILPVVHHKRVTVQLEAVATLAGAIECAATLGYQTKAHTPAVIAPDAAVVKQPLRGRRSINVKRHSATLQVDYSRKARGGPDYSLVGSALDNAVERRHTKLSGLRARGRLTGSKVFNTDYIGAIGPHHYSTTIRQRCRYSAVHRIRSHGHSRSVS